MGTEWEWERGYQRKSREIAGDEAKQWERLGLVPVPEKFPFIPDPFPFTQRKNREKR